MQVNELERFMITIIARAVCPHDCPDASAMLMSVHDGVSTEVRGDSDHPTTVGMFCMKVSRYPELTYHKDRLLYPLKRGGSKEKGKFALVRWSEAPEKIASRLKAVTALDSDAVLPYRYANTIGLVRGESMLMRFFQKPGALLPKRTIYTAAGIAGQLSAAGTFPINRDGLKRPDLLPRGHLPRSNNMSTIGGGRRRITSPFLEKPDGKIQMK